MGAFETTDGFLGWTLVSTATMAIAVIGLVVAPVLFAVFLVLALPVLVLLGLFGLGWAVAAA